MYLEDAKSRLWIELSDESKELFTQDILDRAIQKAVSDLSRFLPLDSVYEVTLVFEVTDEAWTSAAAAGTEVSLANKPISYDSETVKNLAGTACVRDTDYYMNYIEGKITHISGGNIGNAEACTITYDKSKISVDISSILVSMIRVERVEYPVGSVPQTFVPFAVWKNVLTVTGGEEGDSQEALTENKHLLIMFKAKHTAPSLSAEGSYPSFLDDTIIFAASSHALMMKVIEYEQQAAIDIASARTELGNINYTAAETALAKIDTYLAGASAPSVKKYLDDGDAIADAIDLSDAIGHLSDGASKIDQVNVGSRVAENYSEYASIAATIEAVRARQAEIYAIYAQRSNEIASGFITEAMQRIAIANQYLGEADRYIASAMQNLAVALRLREEAIERRNEVWAIWRDAPQYAPLYTSVPVRQTTVG